MDRGAGPVAVGVDEAGRGAWLGPLVVGAFAVPVSRLDALPAVGARDSKALTPPARDAVYDRLRAVGVARSVTLLPASIDAAVAHRGLNLLEATAFARLVGDLAPSVAYLDACDANAERFGRTVGALLDRPPRIVSRHRADQEFPIVGAASIVAKVRRDRAIERLSRRLGASVGSGYPSDPRTVAFVRSWVAASGRARPPWLRASWATTQRIIPRRPGRTLDERWA